MEQLSTLTIKKYTKAQLIWNRPQKNQLSDHSVVFSKRFDLCVYGICYRGAVQEQVVFVRKWAKLLSVREEPKIKQKAREDKGTTLRHGGMT